MSQNLNQNDDDNWYLRDFNTPKKSGPVFANPLFIIGAFGITSIVLFVILLAVNSRRDANNRAAKFQPAANGPFAQDPFRVGPRVNSSDVSVRQQRAREAFAATGPMEGITAEEQKAVDEFLPKLFEAMNSDASAPFQSLFNLPEFRRRVRGCRTLTPIAIQEFERQFDRWLVLYSPIVEASRLEVASIQKDQPDSVWHVYLWVYRSSYPERCALQLINENGALRLIDFEHIEFSELLSDRTAREFSSAFEDSTHRNFAHSCEVREKVARADEDIERRKQQLREISALEFPSLLSTWELHRIAEAARGLGDNELFAEVLDRIERTDTIPVIKWDRAIIAITAQDFSEALQHLQEFTELVGEGPDTIRLRSEIATGLEDNALARQCWMKLVLADPEDLPWSMPDSLGDAEAKQLAEDVKKYRDSNIRAARMAVQLLNRDRMDLAEQLIPIAESMESPTAALFELRAAMNELEGDDESRLKNLQQAWAAQTTDASNRLRLFNLYAMELQKQERGDEAIRISDDPGTTFQMLSIDDYGYLTVPLPEFTHYVETLEAVTATTDEAKANLELWKRLAPITLANEQQDYEKTWPLITGILTPDPGGESSTMLELLEEREYRWLVDEYLVKAAVRLGRITEGWKLHSPEFRLRAFLWQLEENEAAADAFRSLAEIAKHDSETDTRDLLYFEARALWQEKKVDECRKMLCAIQTQTNESPYATSYHASSLLLKLVLETKDVRPLLPELPPEFAASQLANNLIDKDRLDEAQAVVDFAGHLAEPPAGIVVSRLALMAKKKDWQALCLEGTQTLQTPASSTGELVWDEVSKLEYFFQAFLESGDFEHAQTIIDRVGDHWKAAGWKFQLALARNDLQAAETEMTGSEFGMIPDAGFLVDRFRSDDWREFRMRHPMPLSQSIQTHYYLPSSLLLTSEPPALSAESITSLLRNVTPDVQVKDYSELLNRAEVSGRDALMSQTQTGLSGNVDVTGRQCYLVTVGEFTFLLLASNKPLEGQEGRFPEPAIRLRAGTDETVKNADEAILKHQGWVDLKLFSSTEGPAFLEATKLQARLLAALMTDAATLIVGSTGVFPVNEETRSAFQTSQSESLKPFATVELAESVGLYKALSRRAKVAVHTLCRRLKSQPEGQASRIQLLVIQPGISGHDDLVMLLPLRDWTVKGTTRRFVVDSTDCLWIPESRRGEPMQIFEWQIVGWVEQNP
ncbi:MAG: hypothetical protein JNM43_07630 [Planctomycetaceae bacterium]|nr:hypothetical protein [Planctomycetaceae bacterium]